MRGAATIFRFVLGAFVSLALAVSPAAALAGAKMLTPLEAMAADEGAPCDMPCDGCGDGADAAACVFACMGTTAAVQPAVSPASSMRANIRIAVPPKIPFVGRELPFA
jgi:hypothetical protein